MFLLSSISLVSIILIAGTSKRWPKNESQMRVILSRICLPSWKTTM